MLSAPEGDRIGIPNFYSLHCRRILVVEDTGLGEIPAVQSLSEFTVGETSRKRVLTCGVTGDLQVFVVCDAVPAAAFDRLESAFREFLQRVQLRAQAQ